MALKQKRPNQLTILEASKYLKNPVLLKTLKKYNEHYDVFKQWGDKILLDFGSKRGKLKELSRELESLGFEKVNEVGDIEKPSQFLAGTGVYSSGVLLPPSAKVEGLTKAKLIEPIQAWINRDILNRSNANEIANELKKLKQKFTVVDIKVGGDTYSAYKFKSEADRLAAKAKFNEAMKRLGKGILSHVEVSFEKLEEGVKLSSDAAKGHYLYIYAAKREVEPTAAEVRKSTAVINQQVNAVSTSTVAAAAVIDTAIKKMKSGEELTKSDLDKVSKEVSKLESNLRKHLAGLETVKTTKGLKSLWYKIRGRKTKLRALIAETRLKLEKFKLTAANKGQAKAEQTASDWERKYNLLANDYLPRLEALERKQKAEEEARKKAERKKKQVPQSEPVAQKPPVEIEPIGTVRIKREHVQKILKKLLKENKAWDAVVQVNTQIKAPQNAVFSTLRPSESRNLKQLLLKMSKKEASADKSLIRFTIEKEDFVKYLKSTRKPPKEFRGFKPEYIVSMELEISRNVRDNRDRLKVRRSK